ncbi:MAG: hypothetical protein ACYC3I_11905 [Gemmataceae bacterium]
MPRPGIMELLTCPACGCSVQVADALLGRRVRCFGCRHSFLASVERGAPPHASPSGHEREPVGRLGTAKDEEEVNHDEGGPHCPNCDRRITWRDLCCPYCGEELEPEDGTRSPAAQRFRRDLEPHRGSLILSLGNLSMIVGGLSLCTFGAGAVLSVPLGILAWVMANRDLERMRDGRMDPRGKTPTRSGRTAAVAGVILGLIFASFCAFLYLAG